MTTATPSVAVAKISAAAHVKDQATIPAAKRAVTVVVTVAPIARTGATARVGGTRGGLRSPISSRHLTSSRHSRRRRRHRPRSHSSHGRSRRRQKPQGATTSRKATYTDAAANHNRSRGVPAAFLLRSGCVKIVPGTPYGFQPTPLVWQPSQQPLLQRVAPATRGTPTLAGIESTAFPAETSMCITTI